MYGRPLIYSTWSTEYYGPYMWTYALTDEHGEATFDIRFDDDYLLDFGSAFGSVQGINDVDDVVLYMRVLSTQFDWEDYKITW